MESDINLLVKKMYSIKKLLQTKLFYYIIAIFVSVLVIFNLSIFILINMQYNNETKREYESLTEMVSHLGAQEDEEVLNAYLEHYVHTHQVTIVFINHEDQIIYDNDINNDLVIFDEIYYHNQYVGKISVDFQYSALGAEYSFGFLVLNVATLFLFILGSYMLYKFISKQNDLLSTDFSNMMSKNHEFSFKETDYLNKNLILLVNRETKQQQIYMDYIKKIAHDIKTPLTVISMYLEALKNNKMNFDQDLNKAMTEELEKIEGIIPKFIEMNTKQISYRQDISKYIKEFIEKYQDVFESKHIKIKTELNPLWIEISDDDLSRIVEHLIFNAFYYSNENKIININTINDRYLIIEDQGIGMSKKEIENLFKGSFRSKRALSYHTKGSGIGFQIVLEIIKKLDAKIDIESDVDVGTKVIIDFKK